MDILVKGKTGSGKTTLLVTKAGEFVSAHHRVFHLVPLRSLQEQLYQRYKALYGDIVTRDVREGYRIYVLTYNRFVQYLSLSDDPKSTVFYDVLVFDEFSLITNPVFSPYIYASLVDSSNNYRRYFVSATPVDIGIRYDDVIELPSGGSKYKVVRVKDKWGQYVDPNLKGFIYVPGIESTVTVCERFVNMYGGGVDVDTDDPVLAKLLSHRVAYYNSRMSPADREKVTKLLEAGDVDLVCTTTALNYGVDFKFDYAIFTSPRFLDKSGFTQFAGRVGRRGEGVVYVTFDPDLLPDPPRYTPSKRDVDFARLVSGDYDYICREYGLCERGLLKSLAYHLVHPQDAKLIVEYPYMHVVGNSDEYRLCVLAYVMRPSSLFVDPECQKYDVNADRDLMGLFKRAINLGELSFADFKVLQEASYKAHILSLLKDVGYEDLSLALLYGLPLENVRQLVRLIDIPYIGRVRAYKLYRNGVTRENICENMSTVRRVVGEKIAGKIYSSLCTSKWTS